MLEKDIALILEITKVRAGWIEARVVRQINDYGGDVPGPVVDLWEDEAFEQWNLEHPVLAGILET